ncbi:MAG: J domain-containing protein [Chloroflexi bacterium]|nr:J domain-containing protein [Chloroflexota bacterium]
MPNWRLILFTIVLMLVSWLVRRMLASRRIPKGGQEQAGESSEESPGQQNGRVSTHRSPFDVLEVAPEATVEDVRSAYRRKVQQYHPDKVADLGPELRQVAERQMKEINAAYDALKRLGRA